MTDDLLKDVRKLKSMDHPRYSTEEDKYEFYKHVLNYNDSGLTKAEYCKKHGLSLTTFTNRKWTIENCRFSKPDLYVKRSKIAREYLASKMPLKKFCQEYGHERSKLSSFLTHLQYMSICKDMALKCGDNVDIFDDLGQPARGVLKKEEPEEDMHFIAIQPTKSLQMQCVGQREVEPVRPKSELKLISNGIKVTFSPDVPSTKVLKFIELLQEL